MILLPYAEYQKCLYKLVYESAPAELLLKSCCMHHKGSIRQFSGPGVAIVRVCMLVCDCVRQITTECNDL